MSTAGMENIRENILKKVAAEAQDIIRNAEQRAKGEIDNAQKQRQRRLEEEKRRMTAEAGAEASRTLAQTSMQARKEILNTKTQIIDEIIDRVKQLVSQNASDEKALLHLIKEAIDELSVNQARIYVSPRDVTTAKKILKRNNDLTEKIVEIKEVDCIGGVIAEDMDAKVRIDNTYETRLELLLEKTLPDISKELFEA